MKIQTKQELYDYLDGVDWDSKRDTKLSSVYFLVSFNNHEEPVYFTSYKGHYFESRCLLHRFPLKETDLVDYVKEMYDKNSFDNAMAFEKTMQRNDWHYDIDCPQGDLFLPDQLDDIKILSETECLDWILDKCN